MKKFFYTLSALFISAVAFSQPCSDLFISEYIEGTSFNKAVEIYNPTSSTINLTGYELRNYFNGNTTISTDFVLALTGTLGAGQTLVIVNSQAGAPLLALADIVTPATGAGTSVVNHNGDDAIALYKNNVLLDVIGTIGTDPGTAWVYGTFTTVNKTLVRKAAIQQGSITWDSTTAVNNWNVVNIDDFSNTGSHTMTPCSGIADTLVRFNPSSASASEAAGTTNLTVTYAPVSPTSAFTAQVVLKSGTASDIGNYTTQTATFAANVNTTTIPITITNNAVIDGNKTFVFAIRNPSGAMLVGSDSLFTLTVTDDDAPVVGPPVYTIAQVRGANADGGPDSLNVTCELRGTVYGVNLRPGGLEFTINDGTAGISVFTPVNGNNFGYTVNEGDSIRIWGDVIVFRGLAQVGFLDTIIDAGAGNVQNPQFVGSLGESTESKLVRVSGCTLANAGQWDPGATSSYNVDCNCNGGPIKLRLHAATTAISAAAPTGTFDIIGIGSQFSTSATPPYTDGYQIVPRRVEDILYGGSISENEASANMSIFPNPSQGRFFVNFESTSTAAATVSLKDLTGRNITVKNVNIVSGNNQIEINENLSAGIYLVSIEMGNVRAVKRIVVR